MLKLITGPAGAGKTNCITDCIRDSVLSGKSGNYLIVPEQYSHEAERELCSKCGSSLSLYAEVLSFTGLARKVSALFGGINADYLDKGGRLLCMTLAVRNLSGSGSLKAFHRAASSPAVQNSLLDAVDTLKAADIGAEALFAASASCEGELQQKVEDLAALLSAYDAVVANGHADPEDALSFLAEQIKTNGFGKGLQFYFDGFTDFTAAETEGIKALLDAGADVTLALTLDSLEGGNNLYLLPRLTAKELADYAGNYEHVSLTAEKKKPDTHIVKCDSLETECEYAALKCLELVKTSGCRFRDIAIAARGFDDYRPVLESACLKYGVPLFISRRRSLRSRALPVLISSAYSLVIGGWNSDDFVTFTGTGLTPYSCAEADSLARELAARRIRQKEKPGFLLKFEKASGNAGTAGEHVKTLADLLDDMKVSDKMTGEGRQVWNTVVSAMEQINAIAGQLPMNREEFSGLLDTILSKYDTGAIPPSLDSITAGDFDRMRRRNLKHLIILGAGDDRLPSVSDGSSIFSEDELEILSGLNLNFGPGLEAELWREFLLIENVILLPSQSLTLSYCGNPAFIIDTSLKFETVTYRDMTASSEAMLNLRYPGRLDEISARWAEGRGTLSEKSVRSLYGDKIHISPSKAVRYFSCKYAYFCHYGLNAEKWKTEEFTAAELGTFTHFVLENVAKDVSDGGGFSQYTDSQLAIMTKKYIDAFVRENMGDLEERSDRFRYLFSRLESTVQKVVRDLAGELRHSDFFPVAFELNFSDRNRFPPIELKNGSGALAMSGIADRVDVCEKDGRKYTRIVDYKTGTKDFSLSDIWYGEGLQMLLYLYVLQQSDPAVVPSGVMYVPANDRYVPCDKNIDDDSLLKKRNKQAQRKGIMLTTDGIPEAWEHGDKVFSPKVSGNVSPENFEMLFKHIAGRLGDMAEGIRCGSIEADPFSYGVELESCRYCDFSGSCGFADNVSGDHVRIREKLDDAEVWRRIAEEANGDE